MSNVPPSDLRSRFPLHLTIGTEDLTQLLAENFTFSNSDPGGFEMASFSTPHDLPQIIRGMPVRLQCGIGVAWEGRVKEVQRSLGAKTLIQCEGYGSLLKDQALSMVFVDRDLSKWGGAGLARQLELAEGKWASGSSSVAPEPLSETGVGIVQTIQEPWGAGGGEIETWYDAGPSNVISIIAFRLDSSHTGIGMKTKIVLESQRHFTVEAESSVNLNSGGVAGPEYFDAKAPLRRYAVLLVEDPAEQLGAEELRSFWSHLAVYGNHGIAVQGSAPGGLHATDIATWLVGASGPIEGLQAGVIEEPAQYVVPHLAYYTPVEGQQVLSDLAKLTGNHWGVWESPGGVTGSPTPRLDFRPHPQQGEPTAYAMRSGCEVLDIREDLTSQYTNTHVAFTEVSGESGLVEARLANPILEAAGITERAINLSLGTSTKAAAESYGERALESFLHQGRVLGSATIKEPVHRMNGSPMAPWMLRAGIDRLRVPDLPSADVWGVNNELPITRVETSVDTTGITTRIEFGLGPNLLELLTARLQEATFGDVV